MPTSDLFLTVLSPRALTAAADGEAIVDAIDADTPEWFPRQWGYDDALSEPFDRGELEKIWGDGVMWYGEGKGSGRPLGSFHAAGPRHFSDVSVSSPEALVDGARAAALLRTLAVQTDAVYGFAHRLVAGDLPTTERRSARISHNGPAMSTNGRFLASTGLPNVWWANVFGPPVVEVLGAQRIASAPAEVVTRLGDDRWYVQLTASILDNETDPDGFERVRATLKRHLGADAFWDPAKGNAGPYRTIRLPEIEPRSSPRPEPMTGLGPAGFTQAPELGRRWEPWSRESRRGVWELRDVPADALGELVAALPEENRSAEVNQIPPLDVFASIAGAVPFARFSGTVVGPGSGTEGVTIDRLWVPADTPGTALAPIEGSADTDERDETGRTLWWS